MSDQPKVDLRCKLCGGSVFSRSCSADHTRRMIDLIDFAPPDKIAMIRSVAAVMGQRAQKFNAADFEDMSAGTD